MQLTQLKEKLFARGKDLGFTDMEMYFASKERFNGSIFKGEIDKYAISVEGGLSFRGLYAGKMGYAYTEKVDESSIDLLLEGARAGAQIIDSEEVSPIFAGSPAYPELQLVSPALKAATNEEKIALLKAVEAECFRLDPRVVNVNYCLVETQNLQRMIANTRGLDRTESANVAYFVVMAVVKDGEETKTAYRPKVVRALSDLDAAAMAREIVEEALSMLGAQPVESKTYPVLLRNTAAADLLETFAGIFHAANGQKGKSLLTRDKVGQPLASALVTIIDDPLMEGGMNCRSFDAEGVASRRLAVVEKGVLKSLLYNLKTALVDGVEPTGHGSRSSYKAALSTASTNLYIEPGTRSLHEMAESMGDGLVITDLQGLHSGANPISGDFSLAAHGYLVEGGRIGRPVNQITVAGNFYDVLKNIVEVGNDMDRRDGLPFLSPTLWIRGLAVAGK